MSNIRIQKISIKNFRSIDEIEIDVDQQRGLIVFCGANNIGKTNILRALALFFDKHTYAPQSDCPHHKYEGSRGGNYRPKIRISFVKNKQRYEMQKNWNVKKDSDVGYDLEGEKDGKPLSLDETKDFLNEINFFFLEAINISFPETIAMLIDEVLEIETDGKRISGNKKALKKQIESVLQSLQGILNNLASNISPLLQRYKEGWEFGFQVPQKIESFRDLLIAETDFYIQDKSENKILDSKGAGLQRLSHILMYFRIIEKLTLNGKSWILAIDEPDVYIHSGLQKELLKHILEHEKNGQFFITTHSPVFIDSQTFRNVNLLEQEVESKYYSRRNKNYNCVSTQRVDLDETIGIKKIKDYLGIDHRDSWLFDTYNVLVEGECDKVYLEKIFDIFQIEKPSIISCSGADNISQYLSFCDEFAQKNSFFKIILDNDLKGREQFAKIKSKSFCNIRFEVIFVDSGSGKKEDKNKNIEIEDLLPSSVLCELLNQILKSKDYKTFSKNQILQIEQQIKQPAFKHQGILRLLDDTKNRNNPENGQNIAINGFNIKKSLAELFKNINKAQIQKILDDNELKKFIERLAGKTCS